MKHLVKRLALPLACALGLAVAAPALAGTNLVGNPGFETGLSGWNTSGSDSNGAGVTLTQAAGGHSGSFAALLTNADPSLKNNCTLNDSPDWVKPTSAGTYTGSIWVRADTAGAPLILRFREWVGSTLAGVASNTVTLSTSWQQVTVSYSPASPGSSTLDFNAYVQHANGAPGTCFYADDASIVLTPPSGDDPSTVPTPTNSVPVASSTPVVMGCVTAPHMRNDGTMGLFFVFTAADWNAGMNDPASFLYQATPAIFVQGYGTMCQLSDLVTYGGDPTQYVKTDYQVNESGDKTPAGVSPTDWGAVYDYYVKK
jgi:Carbohydrate binding domain